MPRIPDEVKAQLGLPAGWPEPEPRPARRPADNGPRPRLLFLLQSQWFKDPARADLLLGKYVQHEGGYWAGRARFCRDMLFMGCKTGQVIDRYFEPVLGDRGVYRDGEGWGDVVFEETTPKKAATPRQVLPADPHHVADLLNWHSPRLVVAFGAVANEALTFTGPAQVVAALDALVVPTCHPCARYDVGSRMKAAADRVGRWLRDNPR